MNVQQTREELLKSLPPPLSKIHYDERQTGASWDYVTQTYLRAPCPAGRRLVTLDDLVAAVRRDIELARFAGLIGESDKIVVRGSGRRRIYRVVVEIARFSGGVHSDEFVGLMFDASLAGHTMTGAWAESNFTPRFRAVRDLLFVIVDRHRAVDPNGRWAEQRGYQLRYQSRVEVNKVVDASWGAIKAEAPVNESIFVDGVVVSTKIVANDPGAAAPAFASRDLIRDAETGELRKTTAAEKRALLAADKLAKGRSRPRRRRYR